VGPKIFSIDRGGTTYSLRLFPIMAYVKMEGEDEESDSEDAFNKKSKTARALTILGGPAANILLAVLLLTTLFSIEGYSSTQVGRVDENSAAAQIGIQAGDKIVSYNGKRTFLPIDVVQFLYVSKGAVAQVEYERDGERFTGEMRPVVHPEALEPKLGISLSSENPADSNVVKGLSPGMPAEKMGIMVGDRIEALNGIEINTADELIDYVKKNGMNPIQIKALRGESVVNVTIMPQEVKSEEWYDIGLAFSTKKGGIFESLWQSLVFTVSIVRSVGYSLIWLITGQAKLTELMGPIGMVSTISTSVAMAPNLAQMLLYLMNVTAYLSIAVGATNLIPFPMLDGGKLVLIGVEAVRGKPISPEKEGYISLVGFALIILLGIYAAYNDIVRIITG
jgi:regulator of sigma E protease